MADAWLYTAVGTLAVAGALFIGALWSSLRVLGRISAVERSLLVLVTQIEQLNERLTREVKQRAAQVRVDNAEEERSISQQAADHLALVPAPSAPAGRPSRLRRRI